MLGGGIELRDLKRGTREMSDQKMLAKINMQSEEK